MTRREREFFIANLLVRIHFVIVMIRWTGLAPREFEFPFPGSLISTCDECRWMLCSRCLWRRAWCASSWHETATCPESKHAALFDTKSVTIPRASRIGPRSSLAPHKAVRGLSRLIRRPTHIDNVRQVDAVLAMFVFVSCRVPPWNTLTLLTTFI